jgi:hypothetical protein
MTLPTFVVIGAMKAGTVSLRHYLDGHPDVFMGSGGMFGEPNFFAAEQNWPRGLGWYESAFDGAGRAAAIGECWLPRRQVTHAEYLASRTRSTEAVAH